MKKFLSALCATTIAATFAVSGSVPAMSAPLFVQKIEGAQTDVQQVQFRDRSERYQRRIIRDGRRDFYRDGDRYYFNGHRGYRNHRSGYRQYNGVWFPAAAFIAGALVTGAIVNNQQPRSGSAHVQWCYDRYRSYQASTNTFQPYNGPRQRCYSPYS